MKSKKAIWIQIILFLTFLGIFLFLRSPYFFVNHIVVTGNSVVSTSEVIVRCEPTGTNIFSYDVDKSRLSIESSPWVESASCTRKLPDTIVVKVSERTPVVFVPSGDEMWLADKHGRILGKDTGDYSNLVALTGVDCNIVPGQFLDGSRYIWGLTVFVNLGPESLDRLSEIRMQQGECTLILSNGCLVYMGKERPDAGSIALALETIIEDLITEQAVADYIDLRFDKPAIKLR